MSDLFMNKSSEDWNKLKHLVDLSAENARLKSEVERLIEGLNAQGTRLLALSFEVERLRKAGDAMVLKVPDMMACRVRAEEAIGLMNGWISAKEGKPSV